MPANEPLMGLPYPLSSDGDDVPRDIKALADAAALKMNLMPRTFATVAARDAFFTANPTLRVAGIVAVIGTGADYAEFVWTGAVWVSWLTPWQAITPAAGFTAASSAAVRLRAGVPQFRGSIQGTVAPGVVQIGTVPALAMPTDETHTRRILAAQVTADGSPQPIFGWVTTTGHLYVWRTTTGGAASVYLSGLGGYSLD